jgi:hypothetical protein
MTTFTAVVDMRGSSRREAWPSQEVYVQRVSTSSNGKPYSRPAGSATREAPPTVSPLGAAGKPANASHNQR